jgi:transcriptional regulator with XRE-family HTH domain
MAVDIEGAWKRGCVTRKATGKFDSLVGSRIRARREELRLTQQRVAKELGVSHQQVRKYEVGENRVSVARLREIADVLEVPIGYFFEGSDSDAAPAVASLYPSAAQLLSLMQQRDLLNAFTQIASPELRRCLVDLAKAMAAEFQPAPASGPAEGGVDDG